MKQGSLKTRIKRARLIMLVTAAAAVSASQKALAQIGPDAFGYRAASSVYNFTDIGTTGTAISFTSNDDGSTGVSLPFNFSFYGTSYNTAFVGTNGLISFGSANTSFSNVSLSGSSLSPDVPAILPLWDDWILNSGASVRYQTFGATGSRQFVIQWNAISPFGNTGNATFQAILYEGTNQIKFQYPDVLTDATGANSGASNGGSATVGIRDVAGNTNGRNLQWSVNQPVITNGQAILFFAQGGGNWLNASGGSWQTGSNWSNSFAPFSADDVTFALTGSYTVAVPANAVAKSVGITAGNVTFDLSGGGSLSTGGAGSTFRVAPLAGQSAVLTIRGGSLVTNSSPLSVGEGGTGTLNLRNAASVSVGTDLTVGGSGVGIVNLNANATLNAGGNILTSTSDTSVSIITLSSGATLSGSNLYLSGTTGSGSAGNSTLNVIGGTVAVSGVTMVWNSYSTFNLGGGLLQAGSLDLGGDSARLNWTSGTIRINNSDPTLGTGSLLGTSLTLDNASEALIVVPRSGSAATGTLTVESGGSLSVSDGSVTVTSLNAVNASAFAFTGGSITIQGGTFRPKQQDVLFDYGFFVNTLTRSLAISGDAGSVNRPSLTLGGGATTVMTNTAGGDSILVGNAGGKGAVIVTGSGSLLATPASSGFLGVGTSGRVLSGTFYAGDGTLTLTNGGQARSYYDAQIGTYGGKGIATVDGPGSSLVTDNNGSILYVGTAGITVGAFRYVSGTNDYGPGTGTLTLTNGGQARSANTMVVGQAGGKGVVTVDGAGSKFMTTSNAQYVSLYVGFATYRNNSTSYAGDGTLILTNGGYASSYDHVFVGRNGGQGAVTVDGAGSLLTSTNGSLYVGDQRSTWGTTDYGPGIGTLNLSNGGRASSGFGVFIGDSGGKGVATIDGSGSMLGGTIALLYVGNGSDYSRPDLYPSDGTLTLTSGGQAISTSTTAIGQSGGKGMASVDGVGSKLASTNGSLIVGQSRYVAATYDGSNNYTYTIYGPGDGTLAITNGGQASGSNGTYIGVSSAKGTATVDGPGSLLATTSGDLYVGFSRFTWGTTDYGPGIGTLALTNGGQATSYAVYIGSSDGKGLINVGKADGTDTGGTRLSATNLYLGQGSSGYADATATLNVYPGGTVDLTGTLTTYFSVFRNDSRVNLAGGVLRTGYLVLGELSHFNWTSGTLDLTSSSLVIDTGGTLTTDLNVTGDKYLRVSGPGQSLIVGAAGSFTTTSLTVGTSPFASSDQTGVAGTFAQWGGTTRVIDSTQINPGGTFSMTSGDFTTTSMDAGGAGGFTFTGGNLTISGGTFIPKPQDVPYDFGAGTGVLTYSLAISGPTASGNRPTLNLRLGAVADATFSPGFNEMVIGNSGGNGAVLVTGGSFLNAPNLLLLGICGKVVSGAYYPGDGTLTLTDSGQARSGRAYVGDLGGKGAVSIDGADSSLAVTSGYLYVGSRRYVSGTNDFGPGDGTLTITNGGQASASGYAYVGYSGGRGMASVDGASSSLSGASIFVGTERYSVGTRDYGPADGTLALTNGGRATGYEVYIGTLGGKGLVSVGEADGTDTGDTKISATNLYLGQGNSGFADASATLNVYPGGTVELTGTFNTYVNSSAPSSTRVNLTGGVLRTGYLLLGDLSHLNWTAGTLDITSSSLVVDAGGTLGTNLNVTGSRYLRVSGPGQSLIVGNRGNFTTTSLTVGTGTFTPSDQTGVAGTFTQAGGTTLVTGLTRITPGGAFTMTSGSLTTTSLNAATAGSFTFTGGNLTIAGGTFTPKQQNVPFDFGIGNGTGTFTGSVNISGDAGSSSRPTLILSSGAATAMTNTGETDTVFIGNLGGNGAVTVTGNGTLLTSPTNSGFIVVGNGGKVVSGNYVAGDGILNVTNGGQARSYNTIDIGYFGGKGVATVDGAGSKLVSSFGYFTIGYTRYSTASPSYPSDGTLTLTNGGQAICYFDTYVGYQGGKGVVNVAKADGTDTGDTRLVSLNLHLGQANTGFADASASVNVYPGGTVDLTGTLFTYINSAAPASNRINLAGGTIRTGSLFLSDLSHLNWTTGTLDLTASNLTVASSGTLGSSLTITGGKYLRVSGTGQSLSVGTGGTFTTTSLTVGGGTFTSSDQTGVASTFNHSGGTTTVTGLTKITPAGSFSLTGGRFSTASLDISNPSSFAWSAGTLAVTGPAGATVSASGINALGQSVTLGTGKTLTVTNTLLVFTGSTLSITGGSASAGALTINGQAFVSTPNSLTTPVITGRGSLSLSNTASVSTQTLALNSLDVSGTASFTVASTGSPTVALLNSLSITGSGRMDLTNNLLVVRITSLPVIRQYVSNWYAGGLRNGPGLGTSLNSNPYTTLAVFSNLAYGTIPYFASLGGISLLPTDTIVRYTYLGDTNLDGRLDGEDYRSVMEGYLTGQSGWMWGDVDNSGGVVTATDLQRFLLAYDAYQANPVPLGTVTDFASSLAVVPEPATSSLFLALPATGFLRHRRRLQ